MSCAFTAASDSIPLRDLSFLFHLSALESLTLCDSFDSPLDEASEAALTPVRSGAAQPSTHLRLPNLREFNYEPRSNESRWLY